MSTGTPSRPANCATAVSAVKTDVEDERPKWFNNLVAKGCGVCVYIYTVLYSIYIIYHSIMHNVCMQALISESVALGVVGLIPSCGKNRTSEDNGHNQEGRSIHPIDQKHTYVGHSW